MNRIHFISKDKVALLKEKIIGVVCNSACDGHGVIFDDSTKELKDCNCIDVFKKHKSYIGAGIPKKYWDFELSFLLEKFISENDNSLSIIKTYCSKIEKMVDAGVGLYLQGVSGVAKTALSFYIMKIALHKNIPCYSLRLSQLTKLLYESTRDDAKKDLLQFIKEETELLFIDEIEKEFAIGDTSKFMGSQVNDFFGYLYDNQRYLIVASNVPKLSLKNVHAFNIVDRLQELVDIVLVGESFRSSSMALQKIIGD